MGTVQLDLFGQKLKDSKLPRRMSEYEEMMALERCPICDRKIRSDEDVHREDSIEFFKECYPEVESDDYNDYPVLLFWHCCNCSWQSTYFMG